MAEVLITAPARTLAGSARVPGDKSISHRAVMLGALAQGRTAIEGFLPGEDTLATARVFSQLGARIAWLDAARTRLAIEGCAMDLAAPQKPLDCGNAGTLARLLLGVLAGQPFSATVVGDASLSRRPMRRVVEPLSRMGAEFVGEAEHLPIVIRGRRPLRAITHRPEVASAQVKSAVLLAGLYADGTTTVIEPRPTRDHTERMLAPFGQPVAREGARVSLTPVGTLSAPEEPLRVPADPSSAAFLAVAALIVPGSEVRLEGVGINPRRDGWRRILAAMGAAIEAERVREEGGEPVADLVVRYTGPLANVEVPPEWVPDAIDEFPILFVAAACARGRFVLRGASELRVKESDRIATMAAALSRLGVRVEELEDGVIIEGRAGAPFAGGVEIDACHDHRVAMAAAVAAAVAEAPVRIVRAREVRTSFPNFVELAGRLGLRVRWEQA